MLAVEVQFDAYSSGTPGMQLQVTGADGSTNTQDFVEGDDHTALFLLTPNPTDQSATMFISVVSGAGVVHRVTVHPIGS